MIDMVGESELEQKDLTDRCLKACGELLAPVVISNPQSLGAELVVLARREGWAVQPVALVGDALNAAFSAWIMGILDTTWRPADYKFPTIIDSIKAALDGVGGGAVRVTPDLDCRLD